MNTYLSQLQSISAKNKYTQWYTALVEQALERQIGVSTVKQYRLKFGYAEQHHILPKSFRLGGEKDPTNLVFFTAREHFIAHKLLVKMVDGQRLHKMLEAFAYFSNNTRRKLLFTSRDYELIKRANSAASKVRNAGNQNYKFRVETPETARLKAENASNSRWVNNGVVQSFTQKHEEMVATGEWSYGRFGVSEEMKQKLSRHFTGIKQPPRTDQQKQNYSIARKKYYADQKAAGIVVRVACNAKIQTCERCGMTMTSGNYARWHGPKCKKAV